MHRVNYTKRFLTGNLAGFEVQCSVTEPDAEHALKFIERLADCSYETPGIDCVTGAQFVVLYAETELPE